MKITEEWLKERQACSSSVNFAKENNWLDLNVEQSIDLLIWSDRFADANWLIIRVMEGQQNVEYAAYAVRQALHIFEEKHPGDERPRNAIEAAEAYLDNPCRRTKASTAAAAYAAVYAGAYAFDAAAAAAYAAAYAAYAAYADDAADADAFAAAAAYAGAYAFDAAAADAADAFSFAFDADDADDADDAAIKAKILKNGLKILKEQQ